jgi:hypothetical protein
MAYVAGIYIGATSTDAFAIDETDAASWGNKSSRALLDLQAGWRDTAIYVYLSKEV